MVVRSCSQIERWSLASLVVIIQIPGTLVRLASWLTCGERLHRVYCERATAAVQNRIR